MIRSLFRGYRRCFCQSSVGGLIMHRATIWCKPHKVILWSLVISGALMLWNPRGSFASGSAPADQAGGAINVVAAENFYGNIVQQLGGSHVKVTSILSDPSADPHKYESDVNDA